VVRLYHFCCTHSYQAIAQTWQVVPVSMLVSNIMDRIPDHPLPPLFDLAWFTDMEVPDRQALGLTSRLIRCDRTERRLVVLTPWKCQPWRAWSMENLERRQQHIARELLSGDPTRWWVSPIPVPVAPPSDERPLRPSRSGLAHHSEHLRR